MPKQGPDVVSEEGFRELLSLGYQAVAVCSEPPERRAGVWYGLWHILCVSLDGQSEKILVTFRTGKDGSDKPREFKTVTGLISFLYGVGIRSVTIPMEPGARVAHNLLHHGSKPL